MSDFKKGDTASWDAEQVRRSEPQRRPRQTTARKRRRKKRINPLLYILFVLITSAILAGVGWLLITDLCAFNKEYMETTVEITADDTVKTVADKLNDAGLIKYKWFFRLFAGVTKADEKIGMGTYTLTTDMDYQALIRGMRSSAGNMTAETVKVTIPEGYTVSQIIKLLAKNGVAAEETLLKVAQTYQFDYDFIDNTSEDISRLEGYLFPDTYEFYANITSESQVGSAVFGKLLSTFNSRIDDELLEAMAAKGYDMHDIVTIASPDRKGDRRHGPGDDRLRDL